MPRKSKKRTVKKAPRSTQRYLKNVPKRELLRRPSLPKGKYHARSLQKQHFREFFLSDQFFRTSSATESQIHRTSTKITPRGRRSYFRDTVDYRRPYFKKECVVRKARRVSLFATGKAGKGRRITGPKRITVRSEIRCK